MCACVCLRRNRFNWNGPIYAGLRPKWDRPLRTGLKWDRPLTQVTRVPLIGAAGLGAQPLAADGSDRDAFHAQLDAIEPVVRQQVGAPGRKNGP